MFDADRYAESFLGASKKCYDQIHEAIISADWAGENMQAVSLWRAPEEDTEISRSRCTDSHRRDIIRHKVRRALPTVVGYYQLKSFGK